ncbi:MAG: hypothetical protein ABI451_07215, partial [Dokdonella sp.]
PHADRTQIGGGIGLVGMVGVARIARSLFAIHQVGRASRIGPRNREVVRRFGLSCLGNACLLGSGVLLLAGIGSLSGFWSLLFGGVMILLISGTRSAWLLVAHESE